MDSKDYLLQHWRLSVKTTDWVGFTSIQTPNNNMTKFQVGDKVLFVYPKDRNDTDEKYFVTDESTDDEIESKSVKIVEVDTPSSIRTSLHNGWWVNGSCLELYDVYMAKRKAKAKPEKVDFSQLDKVVMRKEEREEIEAVLKQHENYKKIFDDWGLGEVIEYGKGMTFMFYGGPGTGKTWTANCIAKAMGRKLSVVNAANIQTSEPGGANRNIENAFRAAKERKEVLFLDECDSLITQRNDVGMVLGSEINTLLTEIEKFEGICILATNRIDTMDEALERRISLIVEFPEPNFEQREQIWIRLLPKKMPLGKAVKIEKLAEYALTGGQIKNVVLQAARLAVAAGDAHVKMSHFESAINRVQSSKSLMGTASRYLQVKVKEDFVKGNAV